ncbi:MAG: AAA family ATPase [Thermodesulfobacteriota bacterium]
MFVDETKDFLKSVAQKQVKVAVMLHGSMGIGKSWIVKQAGIELGFDPETEIIDLRLAQMEPADLIGIPRSSMFRWLKQVMRKIKGEHTSSWSDITKSFLSVLHITETDDEEVTIWEKPEWFPNAKKHPRGILFLDELNRAPQDVRQAVFQLVNEWRLHTHKLPPGWSIFSAVNPSNSKLNYQVEELDPAMLRRFCNIKVSADPEVWLKWAHGIGDIDDSITGFIAAHPDLLSPKEQFTLDGHPTPDQYRMIDILMKNDVVLKKHQMEVFRGLIGITPAQSLIKFIDANYNRPVTGKEVLDTYEKIIKKLKKQRTDEMHVTVKEVAAELDNRKPSKKVMDNLTRFIEDIPSEHQATVVHKLSKEFLSELMNYPKLTKKIAAIMKETKKG